MAQRDGPAMYIELLQRNRVPVAGQSLEVGQYLRRKGFVDLEQIDISHSPAGAFQREGDRLDRRVEQPGRFYRRLRVGDDAGDRLVAVSFGIIAAAEYQRRCAVIEAGGLAGSDLTVFLKCWGQ